MPSFLRLLPEHHCHIPCPPEDIQKKSLQQVCTPASNPQLYPLYQIFCPTYHAYSRPGAPLRWVLFCSLMYDLYRMSHSVRMCLIWSAADLSPAHQRSIWETASGKCRSSRALMLREPWRQADAVPKPCRICHDDECGRVFPLVSARRAECRKNKHIDDILQQCFQNFAYISPRLILSC